MKSRIYARKKSTREQTPDFSTAPAQPMFQSRSFVVQSKTAEPPQQPDLKTSLMRAQRYGHHLGRMQPADVSPSQTIQPEQVQAPPVQLTKKGASRVLPGNLKFSRKPPFFKRGNDAFISGPTISGPTIPQGPQQVDESRLAEGGKDIPPNLHFFWKGEEPGREGKEWEHLKQWGKMDKDGWNTKLWTDQASQQLWQKNHPEKLEELKNMGINVEVADEQIDKRNRSVYNSAINNDARTMASDVARYSILKNHGGIYADLDMTPGKLKLPNPDEEANKLKSGKLPFFGPRIQDETSVKNATPGSLKSLDERLQETVRKKNEAGEFNNNLIAVEENNPTIEAMIEKIGELKEGEGHSDLKSDKKHLSEIAPTVTGPHMAGKVMREQMGLNPDPLARVPEGTQYMNSQLRETLMQISLLSEASKDRGENAQANKSNEET